MTPLSNCPLYLFIPQKLVGRPRVVFPGQLEQGLFDEAQIGRRRGLDGLGDGGEPQLLARQGLGHHQAAQHVPQDQVGVGEGADRDGESVIALVLLMA